MNICGKPDCYITNLHTHQISGYVGIDGVIGQVCKHGSLARSCYICELESERDALKERIKFEGKTQDKLIAEIDRLKAELEKVMDAERQEQFRIINERDLWKSKADKLRGALTWIGNVCETGYCKTIQRHDLILKAKEALVEFDDRSEWRNKIKDVMDKGSQTL